MSEAAAPVRLSIEGMTCATCAQRIEKVLHRQEGVLSAQVNLASEVATIAVGDGVPLAVLLDAIDRAGFSATPAPTDNAERAAAEAREDTRVRKELLLLLATGALTAPLVAPMALAPFGIHWMPPGIVQLLLAAPVQLVSGARFYKGALGALRARTGNMDLLVALGTSAAFGLSVFMLTTGGHLYFEASAAVITLVMLGKWLEGRAKRGTTRAIRALMDLRPQTARLLRDGAEVEVPAEAVGRGQTVVVRPGERVPVDGRVLEGRSQLDESLLTGESLPVTRGVGDDITGGSINGDGLLRVEATRVGDESMLANIIAMVEGAQEARAPIQRTVDRVAAVFVPAVVVAAALTFGGWLLVGAGASTAIINAVSVLVIEAQRADGGHRRRRQGRHPHQGRRGAGARARRGHRGLRQDRHPDRGPPRGAGAAGREQAGGCE